MRQRALVIRVQMLDQDKRHSRVNGQVLQQLREGVQTASGGANANDRKSLEGYPFAIGFRFDDRYFRLRGGSMNSRARMFLSVRFEFPGRSGASRTNSFVHKIREAFAAGELWKRSIHGRRSRFVFIIEVSPEKDGRAMGCYSMGCSTYGTLVIVTASETRLTSKQD